MLSTEKFLFLVLARNMIMLQHLFIYFNPVSVNWSLTEGWKQGKFQTFSSKSGCGRLWEVVAHKRFQYSNLTFGISEDWLLRRGGRLWDDWSQAETVQVYNIVESALYGYSCPVCTFTFWEFFFIFLYLFFPIISPIKLIKLSNYFFNLEFPEFYPGLE